MACLRTSRVQICRLSNRTSNQCRRFIAGLFSRLSEFRSAGLILRRPLSNPLTTKSRFASVRRHHPIHPHVARSLPKPLHRSHQRKKIKSEGETNHDDGHTTHRSTDDGETRSQATQTTAATEQ